MPFAVYFLALHIGVLFPKCTGNPPGTVTFDSTQAASLIGSFTIQYVDTTQGINSGGRTDIVLWANDSAHRYQYMASRIGRDYGERPFGGSYRWPKGKWIDPEEPYRIIKVHGVHLYFGDTGLNDGTGMRLTILQIGPSGFFGRWTEEMGIAMLVDSKGNRLPDPAGHYCAWRREPFRDAPKPVIPGG